MKSSPDQDTVKNTEAYILPGLDHSDYLESFDSAAFISADNEEQKVCNFILALALIHSDFKNITWAWSYLLKSKSRKPNDKTTYTGHWLAFYNHLLRLECALYHELFNLIEENKRILEHPLFKKTLSQCSKDTRDAWTSLVSIVIHGDTEFEPFKKTVLLIRNKMTSHYSDLKDIAKGYKAFFVDASINGDPVMARGNTLRKTRFYFADAVIQQNFVIKANNDFESFAQQLGEVSVKVLIFLNIIVERFIQARNFPFKKYEVSR